MTDIITEAMIEKAAVHYAWTDQFANCPGMNAEHNWSLLDPGVKARYRLSIRNCLESSGLAAWLTLERDEALRLGEHRRKVAEANSVKLTQQLARCETHILRCQAAISRIAELSGTPTKGE